MGTSQGDPEPVPSHYANRSVSTQCGFRTCAFSIAGIDDDRDERITINVLAHDATTPREFVSDQVDERRRARASRSLEV